VLSHALWQRRYGGDPAIPGRAITLNGQSFTVVGVTAPGFTGEERLPPTELWYPVTARPGNFSANRREFVLTGRFRAGSSPGQARAEATTIFARPEWQALGVNRLGERVRVVSEEESRMDHGGRLTFLMGPVVGLVLLVACANVSCLLLGRYEERRREIAVRLALGASRWRVLRYLLTEAVLLALLGGALGLVFTTWGTRVLPTLLPATLASWAPDVHLDQRVLGLTLGLSLVATLAFGLMPAWRASRLEITTMLKSDSGNLGRTPSRNVLVVLQVAIAMAFLTVAALFVRGFWSGMTRDLGFSERNLMLAYLAPEGRTRMDFGTMLDLVRQRVAALPGVRGVTLANNLVGGGRTVSVRLPEDEASGQTEGRSIASNNVDPGFFATVGIPLQQGRDFNAHDVRGGRRVAIVSEAMARKLWPQGNAIGQTLLAGRTELVPREIVGVARDVSDLVGSAAAVSAPYLYLPLRQEQSGDLMLIVATRRSPAALAAPVREALRHMDTPMGSFMFDTLDGRLKMALLPQWFGAWLGGVLGVLAFVLAVSGLYGVVAYAVARRTRELGIRIALGATSGDAVRLVVRQGLVLAAVGVVVGLPLAMAAGALLSSTLYGISPTDPFALTGSALVVTTVAAFASYLPACRAAKVDPMIALRVE
jgi:predicted permease